MIEYDEIMMKYVEGKLIPMYDWIISNLEKDPARLAGEDKDKETPPMGRLGESNINV